MDKPSQQTNVIGGILVMVGLIILFSQFPNSTVLTLAVFLASVGGIMIGFYLHDRSHHWLMLTSYVLWVLATTLFLAYGVARPEASIAKILPAHVRAEELMVLFILSAIALPFWVGYFKNKKPALLIVAYSFTAILLVILTTFYTSGEFLFALILYAAAVPMLYSYFKGQNHTLFVPGYFLAAFATSFLIGQGLEHLFNSDIASSYALGIGSIVSVLGLFALRPLIKNTNLHAKVQLITIGGIILILGGLMLFGVRSEISVRTVYFVLVSMGMITGAWYLFDRSLTWLGLTSYVLFVIVGIIYLNIGGVSLSVKYQYQQYVAPFIFGSIGMPFLLAYFRNTKRRGSLIIGYIFCIFTGFLLLVFSNFLNGILIAPYMSFAVGLPFIFAYIFTETRWALIPGYAILSVGISLLLASIIRDATTLEGAFQYTVAGFLMLAGLVMRGLRPMLK